MPAAYIDSIMMFAVGAYATAVAFGRLPPPTKDVATGQQSLARHGKIATASAKVGPPVAVATGYCSRFFLL
jgi:hypothetical protein